MKTRLTITLTENTLQKIDMIIDKKNIRNRSHAIEHLIEKSLAPTISTAVILAGGSKNETNLKPLAILDTKPLIFYTLDLLKKHGVTNIVIATNNQGKAIEKLLGDGSRYGLTITYHFEEEALGTAGAIKHLEKLLPKNQAFYVLAGDILTTIDLTELANFHTEHQGLVTMAVKPRPTQKAYDNVFMQGHTVVAFTPSQDDQVVSIVNAGIYIFEPEVVSSIPLSSKPVMLETDIFPQLTASGKILAFPFQGVWFDISSDDNYQEALTKIRTDYAK